MTTKIGRIFTFVIMISALIAEAFFVIVTGAWLPEVPNTYHLVAGVWLLSCLSFTLYNRWPWAILVAAWIQFAGFYLLYFHSSESTFRPSFFYANRFPMAFVVASHLDYYLRSRKMNPR